MNKAAALKEKKASFLQGEGSASLLCEERGLCFEAVDKCLRSQTAASQIDPSAFGDGT